LNFFYENSQKSIGQPAHRSDADAFAFEILDGANFLARDDHVRQAHQRRGDEHCVAARCHARNRRVGGAVEKLDLIGRERR
jgi:hypothetical protein